MDWLSIITALKNLIFWLASLIILAPKTLYMIIRHPKLMINVLTEEVSKKPEERYNAYISPITFWSIFSIFVIVLYANIEEYIGWVIGGIFSGTTTNIENFEFDFNSYRITKAIIISIWFPLVFSCVILLLKKIEITKTNLENIFYLQCYSFGGFVALYTFFWVIFLFLPVDLSFQSSEIMIDLTAILPALIWLIHVELLIFKIELIKHKTRTLYLFIFLSIVIAIIMVSLNILIFKELFNNIL